jgi:hypothetical protein
MIGKAARFNTIGQQIRGWNAPDPGVPAGLDEAGREGCVPEACRESSFADIGISLPRDAKPGQATSGAKVGFACFVGIAAKRAGAARRGGRACEAAALVNAPRAGQFVFSVF